MEKKKKQLILGLTGAIASGKSEIRQTLESVGCLGIDADLVSHDLILPGEPAFEAIVARYGEKVLQIPLMGVPEINRTALGRVVFSDKNELDWLESMLHPAITQRIAEMTRTTDRHVVIEAIKLMDSGLRKLCGQFWLAEADESIRVQRLMEKRGYSYEMAVHRISAQKNIQWDAYRFDAVINTAVPLPVLQENTHMLWNAWIGKSTEHDSRVE